MPRAKSLTSMSVDVLLKMRDDVTAAIGKKADALKKELAEVGADYKEVGRTALDGRKGKSAIAGRKVPPKYRSPNGETWAGRGAQPVWLREAIKAGKKADDFLIAKGAKKSTAKKAKRAKKKRVAVKRAEKSANNAKTKSSGATTYSYRI